MVSRTSDTALLLLYQGMQMGLRVLAAAGALTVGTGQDGPREMTRFEPLRDSKTGNMSDQPAFEEYLKRVERQGVTPLPGHQTLITCFILASASRRRAQGLLLLDFRFYCHGLCHAGLCVSSLAGIPSQQQCSLQASARTRR
jgi:hypothetical protein